MQLCNVLLIKALNKKQGVTEKPKKSRKPITKIIEIMSYSLVKIVNSTPYIAEGKAIYVSVFCSDDSYSVTPNTTWEAKSRGICLLKEITADVKTPQGIVKATPFHDSIGTTDSRFAIIQTGPTSFEVTKIVNLAESTLPEDYVEPIVQQN